MPSCGGGNRVLGRVRGAGPTTRTVYVTVVDAQGRAVPGLTPDDFVDQGKRQGARDRVGRAGDREDAPGAHGRVPPGRAAASCGSASRRSSRRMCASADVGAVHDHPASREAGGVHLERVHPDRRHRQPPAEPAAARARPCPTRSTKWRSSSRRRSRRARSSCSRRSSRARSTEVDPEGILWPGREEQGAVLDGVDRAGGIAARGQGDAACGISPAAAQIIGDGPHQSGGRRIPILTLPAFETGLQQVADDLSSQYLITYSLPERRAAVGSDQRLAEESRG